MWQVRVEYYSLAPGMVGMDTGEFRAWEHRTAKAAARRLQGLINRKRLTIAPRDGKASYRLFAVAPDGRHFALAPLQQFIRESAP